MEVAKNLFETLKHLCLMGDNITIPVASPENLIEIKKLSNRPQDLLDIQAIREEYRNL